MQQLDTIQTAIGNEHAALVLALIKAKISDSRLLRRLANTNTLAELRAIIEANVSRPDRFEIMSRLKATRQTTDSTTYVSNLKTITNELETACLYAGFSIAEAQLETRNALIESVQRNCTNKSRKLAMSLGTFSSVQEIFKKICDTPRVANTLYVRNNFNRGNNRNFSYNRGYNRFRGRGNYHLKEKE